MKMSEKLQAEQQKNIAELEDSAWLIRAEQSEVRITLGASDQRYYYEKGAKNE